MVVQSDALDDYEDRRLVAAFQDGDIEAFSHIVMNHHASLVAKARRKLGSSVDAEDAVQETLIRAYLALDRFGGDYRLGAWLSRILANVCSDTGSRRAAEVRLVDRLGTARDEAPPADEGIADFEQLKAVQTAVNCCPTLIRPHLYFGRSKSGPTPTWLPKWGSPSQMPGPGFTELGHRSAGHCATPVHSWAAFPSSGPAWTDGNGRTRRAPRDTQRSCSS